MYKPLPSCMIVASRRAFSGVNCFSRKSISAKKTVCSNQHSPYWGSPFTSHCCLLSVVTDCRESAILTICQHNTSHFELLAICARENGLLCTCKLILSGLYIRDVCEVDPKNNLRRLLVRVCAPRVRVGVTWEPIGYRVLEELLQIVYSLLFFVESRSASTTYFANVSVWLSVW